MENAANYTFLSLMVPEQLREAVAACSAKNMPEAANSLEWHIYEGLCENLGAAPRIINILPIGSYPQYYRHPFVSSTWFCAGGRGDHLNVGFCNIKFLRKYWIPGAVYRALKAHYASLDEPGVLLVYSASAAFMKAIAKIRKKYPALKICAVIADLPDMSNLSSNQSLIHRLFLRHLADKSYGYMENVDCFALLTEHMADYMQIKQPYCVMEGIATRPRSGQPHTAPQESKTVLYTGTLHKRFGVLNLIAAFRMIPGEDYRLVICGIGDSEEAIKRAAAEDGRIQFLGQISHDEVLRLQRAATVLVNPRQNREEFTKYSFPSKIMEYLSSGTPVIAYKLDGIPDEYDDYLIYPEDDSVDALARAIREVCQMHVETRITFGENGKQFVLNMKNSKIQVKKILSLIHQL